MRLHYQVTGTGPPLLLLHGLFGSGENLGLVASTFAASFRVFSLDLRNHGRSPHSEEMSYELMAGDLKEFVDEHALGSAHLLGHSLGGKVVMRFTLQHPTKVRSLIVVDIAPGIQPERHRHILDALAALDPAGFKTRSQMEAALEDRIPDLSVRRFLLKSVARDPKGTFRWRLNIGALTRNYAQLNEPVDGFPPFHGPVLFISGENSDYIKNEDELEIQRLFPNYSLQKIPGAGHWVHAEAPGEFVQVIENFYGKHQILSLP